MAYWLLVTNLDFLSLLFIAIGLSADCFAVALSGSCALKNLTRLQILRASLSFGIFQAIMLLLGWLAGSAFVTFIGSFDHWLAFALLSLVGGKMIWESFRPEDEERKKKTDFTKGLLLLILSIATSIDALAVGLSFAFLDVNIAVASLPIGVTAFLITIMGLLLGRKVGAVIGERAELVGGLILIGIGLRILLTHIL